MPLPKTDCAPAMTGKLQKCCSSSRNGTRLGEGGSSVHAKTCLGRETDHGAAAVQNASGSENLHIGTHSSAHALWEQSFRLLQWLSSSTEGKEDFQRHIPNCLAVCLLVVVATQFDT